MTITNGYCSLTNLKIKIGLTVSDHDTDLEPIIEGVSRLIDMVAKRTFYTVTETRYFTPIHGDHIYVDDLVSITTLSVAVNTSRSFTEWVSTDYDTEPANSTPITSIHVAPASSRYFVPGLRQSVKITGVWGYASSVPKNIEEACLLLSQHVWLLKDTPLGSAGSAGILGELQGNDHMWPDGVKALLSAIPKRVRL